MKVHIVHLLYSSTNPTIFNQILDEPKMTVTVCFDALGTCFSLQTAIDALETLMGDELRAAGSDARMTIMDWVGLSL